MIQLQWLDQSLNFPAIKTALKEPDGLLAAGGDLSPERLITAYRQGIFPWYETGQPILWWSPDPRTIILPSALHVSRSMKKVLKKSAFRVTYDQQFRQVIQACAAPRDAESGTWITDPMCDAYCELHRLGYAHSVEVWEGEQLVGGLYGIAIGKVFFGESMFSHKTNASKVGFITLAQHLHNLGFTLIDCQVASAHLFTLGAVELCRDEFVGKLRHAIHPGEVRSNWRPAP